MRPKLRTLLSFAVPVMGVVLIVLYWWRPGTPEEASIDFNNYRPLADQIRTASRVTLYEGLPHQYFEKELLAEELSKQRTVKLHRFPFYEEPIPLSPEDAKRLTDLFCDGKSLSESVYAKNRRVTNPDGSVTIFSVDKACGGFHPDYCLEWDVKGEVYRMLVCFGCGEAKIYGPGHSLWCELDSCGNSVWRSVLGKYQKNRPRPQ